MSGFVISISWGIFVCGLIELPKVSPHTDNYNSLLFFIILGGICGPGMTCLLIINAYLRHLENKKLKSSPLLPEPAYIIV
jgi:hypothetical protein